MSRGFVKLHRGWEDSAHFRKEAYCERAAWAWLLSNAAWKDTHRRTSKGLVEVKRGELHVSLRQLGKVWGWSKGKVERFISVLETAHSVTQRTGQGGRILTICNFNKYQSRPEDDGTVNGTQSGTQTGQRRDTQEESKEDKEDKKGGADAPYAFVGKVIRLKPSDYDAWRTAYSNLDLRAELQSRDDWLATQSEDRRRNWFVPTSNYLAGRNREANAETQRMAANGYGPGHSGIPI
ncbi:hypothetical protein WJS89_10485 [Sphingomicrobium sp. XHP0235]|uniref:hypothetical protein n=1 Tax=Sphingomicrobium aquimarinum TaxID=3133971 RepID=UPI0031FF1FAB